MGQRPDRDEVDARRGHLGDVLERDPTRGLELGAAVRGSGRRDRLPQLGRAHVVEQQPVGSSVGALADLVEIAALDLDRKARLRLARAAHRLPHPAGERGMVLLDQDRVVEAHPVVGPTAGRHRRLLQRPQPRGRLAGVEDARARALDLPHEPRRERCHSREMTEEVERGPLCGEQRPGRALRARHRRGDVISPLALRGEGHEPARPRLAKDLAGNIQAEDDPGRLLGDRGPPQGVLGDDRLGGHVPRTEVLEQRPGDQIACVAVDFHVAHDLTKARCETFCGRMSDESLPPFQALMDEHGSDVLGFLVASVGPHDAEDCFQETFIAALRAYPRLEHARNLRSWLLTIAHRKAIDHHRARGRRAVPGRQPRGGGRRETELQQPSRHDRRPAATPSCGPRSAACRPSSAAPSCCASPPTCPTPASRAHSTARRTPRAAASTKDSRS